MLTSVYKRYLTQGLLKTSSDSDFEKIKGILQKMFNADLSGMRLKVSNQPVFNNGRINAKMNPLDYAGCHTTKGFIQVATKPHLEKVIQRYNVRDTPVSSFRRHMIAHELAHEVYNKHMTKAQKEQYRKKLQSFRTVYTDTVPKDKLDQEKFCEFVAAEVIKQL